MSQVALCQNQLTDQDKKQALLASAGAVQSKYRDFGSKHEFSSKLKSPIRKHNMNNLISSTMAEDTCETKITSLTPSQIMQNRVDKINRQILPEMDSIDLERELGCVDRKRQFAPQYSEFTNKALLSKERVLAASDDPYWTLESRVSDEERTHLVVVIEELNRLKEYKEETMYIACSIADRYIISLARTNHQPECLMNLAVTAILMAAKME